MELPESHARAILCKQDRLRMEMIRCVARYMAHVTYRVYGRNKESPGVSRMAGAG